MYNKFIKSNKISRSSEIQEKSKIMSENNATDHDLFNVLKNIETKLNNPVFNGGFEKLVTVVDDIKASQQKTEEHIVVINKTIYEPDEGLFSRIKTVEKQQEKELNNFKNRVELLERFQTSFQRALWILIPAGIMSLFKIAWDVLRDHIVLR